jgi:hypothetical protein
MTVAADLAAVTSRRRLFLKIDGLEPILWQPTSRDEHGYETPGFFPVDSDCCGAWNFYNEYVATAASFDHSLNGNVATPSDPPSTLSVTGSTGSSRTFYTPAGSYMSVAETSLHKRQTFTAVFRGTFTGSGAAAGQVAFEHTNGSASAWGLGIAASSSLHPQATITFTDASTLTLEGANDLGVSSCVMGLTWDGTTAKLYANGALVDSDATAAGKTVSYGTGGLYIGTSVAAPTTMCWLGTIASVAYYGAVKDAEWMRRAYLSLGYSRTALNCLRPPTGDFSDGLDLAEQVITPSSMSLALDNIADPDAPTTKYFAKMFATSRTASQVTHFLRRNGTDVYLNANSTTVYVDSTNGFASGGVGYLGAETFIYQSTTANTFGSVYKGVWPCISSSNFGYTYKYEGTDRENVYVSNVPYSWVGRRVALYVTTWDAATNYWNIETGATLLWVGRLTDRVAFSAADACWRLSCEHIIKDLEKSICKKMPTSKINKINLDSYASNNEVGISVCGLEDQWGRPTWVTCIIMPIGIYDSRSFMNELIRRLNLSTNHYYYNNGWTQGYPPERPDWYVNEIEVGCISPPSTMPDAFYSPFRISVYRTPPDIAHGIYNWPGQPYMPEGKFPWIYAIFGWDTGSGLEHFSEIKFEYSYAGALLGIRRSWPINIASAFQPIGHTSKSVCVSDERAFATTQGDYNSPIAYVGVENCVGISSDDKKLGLVPITSSSTGKLTQGNAWDVPWIKDLNTGADYAVARLQDSADEIAVRQIYIPAAQPALGYGANQRRGPFKMMLYSLLSTGTDSYNSMTYDKMIYDLSVGMEESLVDIPSFLSADACIMANYPSTADRTGYVIDKELSWIEMFKREGKLFGYFLAWENGKITVKSAVHRDGNEWTQTLSDSNNAAIGELPESSTGVDTVLNQWRFKISYDWLTGKYGPEVIINDATSQASLNVVKSVTVEHPGVYQGQKIDCVEDVLNITLRDGIELFRFPRPVVTVSLSPRMINKIFVGDIVRWESDRFPDPKGTGSMTTSCQALVIDCSWNYEKWTGSARLLLLPTEDDKTPWGFSCLSDITATNGGWDAGTLTLEVLRWQYGPSGGAYDSTRIAAGDKVNVIERAPSDPTSPLAFTALTVDSVASSSITFAAGTTMSAWDPNKEYVVVPADYTNCGANQQIVNAFQADQFNAVLGVDSRAQRWN